MKIIFLTLVSILLISPLYSIQVHHRNSKFHSHLPQYKEIQNLLTSKISDPQSLTSEAFKSYDNDYSGSLDFGEFEKALIGMADSYSISGLVPEHETINKIFRVIDRDNDGLLSKEEAKEGFANLALKAVDSLNDLSNSESDLSPQTEKAIQAVRDEVAGVFEKRDLTKDGKLSSLEFNLACQDLADLGYFNHKLTQSELGQLYHSFDRNGTGFVELKELQVAMIFWKLSIITE